MQFILQESEISVFSEWLLLLDLSRSGDVAWKPAKDLCVAVASSPFCW